MGGGVKAHVLKLRSQVLALDCLQLLLVFLSFVVRFLLKINLCMLPIDPDYEYSPHLSKVITSCATCEINPL